MDAPREVCPSCGQPVHPLAGRCRHCRVDLVQLRADAARAARLAAVRAQAAAVPLRAEVAALREPPEPEPTSPAPAPRVKRRSARVALALLLLFGGVSAGFAAERWFRPEQRPASST